MTENASPEQAQGEHDAVTAQSDIYGLGATLWKIVTGCTPGSSTPSDIDNLKMVHVSRCGPLFSIAAKAMSSSPADRYPSANAVAEEVYRFLSDQLVESHEYSVTDRIFQFTRKHSELISAISITGLLLTLMLGGCTLWINHERQLAIAAKEQETQARKLAENARAEEAIVREQAQQRTAQLTGTIQVFADLFAGCLLYTSPSPRDQRGSRMPSSA